MKRLVLVFAVCIPAFAVLCAGLALAQSEAASGEESDPTLLEHAARAGVEAVVGFIFDTRVKVDRVRIDPETHRLALSGLRVMNPKGFDEKTPAIEIGELTLDAPVKTLFSKAPVVDRFEVTGAVLHAETNLKKGNNLHRLLGRAARFDMPKGKDDTRWTVEHLVLKDTRLRVTTELLTRQTRERAADSIEMTLKGEDGQGLPPADAIGQVLQRLLEELDLLNPDAPLIPLGDLLGLGQ